MIPVVRTDRTRTMPVVRPPRNPLLVRIGMLAGVMLLFVPVAYGLRNDKPHVRAAEIQGVEPILLGRLPSPAPSAATEPPTTAVTTTMLIVIATAAPTTPPPTEAVVVAPAPTEPPTTAKAAPKKKVVAKATTTVAAAKPAVTATQSADKTPCTLTYTIAKGDAWSTIASRAKVTMKALLAANGATINTLLLPGKTICLPTGATAPAPPATNAPVAKPPVAKPPATTQPATTQPKAPAPTNPPATTAPPVTQPKPPANTYTRAQVTQIIRNVWPDDLEDEAIRIATRESNLIPTVRNSCCYGLFQIYYAAHRTWLASMGITDPAQLYDPLINATAALALYNNSGWAPWGTPATTTTVV
jgi:LysM repeat protein